jgi:hypothetical protein
MRNCTLHSSLGVDGWFDGCMDGWMDGWMNGWMDGWMDEQKYTSLLLVDTHTQFRKMSTSFNSATKAKFKVMP